MLLPFYLHLGKISLDTILNTPPHSSNNIGLMQIQILIGLFFFQFKWQNKQT